MLTLSATPIPRTLNLALAGVRDLSVIETPPEDRLPIQTRVAEASAGLVRDAILRELDRGGQVFYVHNRVETIEAQAEQLRRMLPGARFVVGHGQMAEGAAREGDDHVRRRRGRRPRLHDDHRVRASTSRTPTRSSSTGPTRSGSPSSTSSGAGSGGQSRRAYAYLLYRRRERLSEEARKRLQAIFNASELGAGFQIALSDLEIRGAGNILGGEQSGHMAAVGFDLYSRLLAEAVEERKARREDRAPRRRAPQAVVDLPVEAHLPDDYVPEEAQKLELYRRLARARDAGRPRRLPPGGHRPVRADAAAGPAARRGRRAAAGGRGGGRRVDLARGGPARRPLRRRAVAGDGDAAPRPAAALPGRPAGATSRSRRNQVRIRLPRDPSTGWGLTQAVVARLGEEHDIGSPAES